MGCSENCKCRPGVVGIIFVPGMMGSRLQNKRSKELVWDPAINLKGKENLDNLLRELEELQANEDSDAKDSVEKIEKELETELETELEKQKNAKKYRNKYSDIPTVRDIALANPEKRKKMLVNAKLKKNGEERDDDLLEVASGNDDYFSNFTNIPPSQIELKKSRGWGEVIWDSYGFFLTYLEREVNKLITEYPGLHFPVFAVGYNWMLSNEVSGERIKQKLAEYKAQILQQDDRGISEEDIKFIILSHSMGGMASRSAFMLSNLASEVEAVIHCAMPTYGSPDIYKQMKCGQGFEISPFIIGKNAAEITAIFGFCQGALELLPNQLYRTADNNPEWLFYAINKKNNKEKEPMPINYGAEIYEFYKQYDLWYSLIQPDLLAPELPSSDKEEETQLQKYIDAYEKRIDAAKLFHQKLADGFHQTTTLIYSDNPAFKSYDHCCWSGKKKPNKDVNEWEMLGNENNKRNISKGTVRVAGSSKKSKIYEMASKAIDKYEITEKAIGLISGKKSSYERYTKPIISILKPDKYLRKWGKSLGLHLVSNSFTIDPATAKGDGTVHIGSGELPIATGGLKKVPVEATKEHLFIYNCTEVREKVISEIKTWLVDIHHKMGG